MLENWSLIALRHKQDISGGIKKSWNLSRPLVLMAYYLTYDCVVGYYFNFESKDIAVIIIFEELLRASFKYISILIEFLHLHINYW